MRIGTEYLATAIFEAFIQIKKIVLNYGVVAIRKRFDQAHSSIKALEKWSKIQIIICLHCSVVQNSLFTYFLTWLVSINMFIL